MLQQRASVSNSFNLPRRNVQSLVAHSPSYTLRRKFNAHSPRLTPHNSSLTPGLLGPKWLSELKQRVGRCLMFGLRAGQVDAAGQILEELARDWRQLVAGSEGFLTCKSRTGLHRFI